MNIKHLRLYLNEPDQQNKGLQTKIVTTNLTQRACERRRKQNFSSSFHQLIEDSRVQVKGSKQLNGIGSISYRPAQSISNLQYNPQEMQMMLNSKQSVFENHQNNNLFKDLSYSNLVDPNGIDKRSANKYIKQNLPLDKLSFSNPRNQISLTKNASIEQTIRNSSRENSVQSHSKSPGSQTSNKGSEWQQVQLAHKLSRPSMTAGNSTRITKNSIFITKNGFNDELSRNGSKDGILEKPQDMIIYNQVKADTTGINELDDLDYLNALSRRYQYSLNTMLDLLFKIYEFDTQKMITLLQAKKKLEKGSSQSHRFTEKTEQCFKPRGGDIQYLKKMKYFKKIAAEKQGQNYDCNVQTPLTQLKLKGNRGNQKELKKRFYQSEVPHGGIWVKRNSFENEDNSPNSQMETFVSDNFHYQTVYDSQYKKSANITNKTFYTIDAAGCRIPGSHKLTLTDKFPIVKKELIIKGKSRQEIEYKLQQKLEQNREKHRNRSNVGAIIQMHDMVDNLSPDHSINQQKQRIKLDRDQNIRKVNNQNTQAFNQFVIYQNEINQKREKLMKRTQAIEILAHEGDPDKNSMDSTNQSGMFSHINKKLQPSVMVTSIYSKGSNPLSYNIQENKNRYRTVNNEEFNTKQRPNTKRNRKFNKRKSPYQMFSEAKFNMGVYFNPPLNGI